MTTKADLAEQLVAALKPLVAGRVHRIVFPQAVVPTWPAIRYAFVSTSPSQDICGDGGEETADFRVQVDVVDDAAKGPASFTALCASVKSAIAALNPGWDWDSEFEEFDAETKTFRLAADFIVYLSSPA